MKGPGAVEVIDSGSVMKSFHRGWSLQAPYWTVSGDLCWKLCRLRSRDFPSSEDGVEAPEKGPLCYRKSLCLADRSSSLVFSMTAVQIGGSLKIHLMPWSLGGNSVV